MGIEQNKNGVFVPDKNTKWPQMTDPDRSKVYESHKKKYAGTLKSFKVEIDVAKNEFWNDVSSLDYRNEFKASDAQLMGMPVSMALLLTFGREFKKGGTDKMGIYGPETISVKGKEKEMMLYSLNYIQNAPENKALRASKYPKGNIDTVPKDGFVKIWKNEDYRWELQIQDKNHKVLFAGLMFPDE